MRVTLLFVTLAVCAFAATAQPIFPGQAGIQQVPFGNVGVGVNPVMYQQQPLGYIGQQQMLQPGIGQGWTNLPVQQQPILGSFGQVQQPILGSFGGVQQPLNLGTFGNMQQIPMNIGTFGGLQQQPIVGIQQQPILGGLGGIQQGLAGTVAPVLPQDFGAPAAAFGQLSQPVLSPQQLQQVVSETSHKTSQREWKQLLVPTQQLQAALNQRVGSFAPIAQTTPLVGQVGVFPQRIGA